MRRILLFLLVVAVSVSGCATAIDRIDRRGTGSVGRDKTGHNYGTGSRFSDEDDDEYDPDWDY